MNFALYHWRRSVLYNIWTKFVTYPSLSYGSGPIYYPQQTMVAQHNLISSRRPRQVASCPLPYTLTPSWRHNHTLSGVLSIHYGLVERFLSKRQRLQLHWGCGFSSWSDEKKNFHENQSWKWLSGKLVFDLNKFVARNVTWCVWLAVLHL